MVDPLCTMSNSAFQLAPARALADWLTRRLAKPGGVPTSEGVSRSERSSAGLGSVFPNPLSDLNSRRTRTEARMVEVAVVAPLRKASMASSLTRAHRVNL